MGNLREYNEAPKWNQDLADARNEIIQAWFKYRSENPGKPSKLQFVVLYNKRKPSLDISPTTYQKIEKISRQWLDRYLRRWFASKGIGGLLSGHGRRRGRFCVSEIELNFLKEKATLKRRIRPARIYQYFVQRFGPTRSRRTIERIVKKIAGENKQVLIAMRDPGRWRNECQVSAGRADKVAKFFCDLVEIDSTVCDVICRDGRRYMIVAAIDVYSRRALVLVCETSASMAIAALIRKMILSWGIPRRIKVDRGKEYISRHLKSICDTLRITLIHAPPYSPECKGHVERFLQTLAYELFEELPGFCGHNTREGQAIRRRRKFGEWLEEIGGAFEVSLTRDELQKAINNWIKKVYEQRFHRGIKCRPVERAAASAKIKPVRKIPDSIDLNLLLCPVGERTIGKKGISYEGGLYWAPKIGEHIPERVKIRQDPGNVGEIYVFNFEGAFLFKAIDEALLGRTQEDYLKDKKDQKAFIKEKIKALKVLGKESPYPMLDYLEKPGTAEIIPLIPHEEADIGEIQKAQAGPPQDDGAESLDGDGFFIEADGPFRRYDAIQAKLERGEEVAEDDLNWASEFKETKLFQKGYPAQKKKGALSSP